MLQKQINEFLRDVTAMGGLAASLLIILLFMTSPLLVPLIAGSMLTAAFVLIIRIFYFKPRPKKEEFTNFWQKIDASSFPSLHTARIVFLAILFSVYFSNLYSTVLFTVTAALVSYSRVYLQKHDWIDIVGGIALGIAAYFIVAIIL
ncbi:phosphatase PAP2 family protein [Candidatus Woesearchaeota archaeon]|nr:phosphatase PAP2 family protein [Candidatus Woesearchaeota archaeon]